MAVYNGAKYLTECIDSILGQTFRDFEFVVVDDGSTDETTPMLADYARRDARVRVLNQSNQGVAASLNRGLADATGQLIARMDADDISKPGRLARQVKFLAAHPNIGVSGTWVDTIGDNGGGIWRYPVRDDEVRSQLILGPPFAHPAVMMRTQVVRSAGGYRTEYTITEDYDLWVRLANCTAFANLPTVFLMHRLHSGQVCSQESAPRRLKLETRMIQLNLFSQLGITPSAGELDLHEALCAGQFVPQEQFVLRMSVWLSKLEGQNRHTQAFPQAAFTRLLGYRWWSVCWGAHSLGIWTWKQYWRSPLGYRGGVRAWRAGWLGLNCGLRELSFGQE